MTYRLLLYYPGEDLFIGTNHTSDDVDFLWQVAARDEFRGHRTRIINEAGEVVCEPPVRSKVIDPSASETSIRKLWLPN